MSTIAEQEKRAKGTAGYVARLQSRMSFRDQEWAFMMVRNVMYGVGAASFCAGYFLQTFWVVTYAVSLAALLCVVIACPNWRQRPDKPTADAQWVSAAKVTEYYHELEELKTHYEKLEGNTVVDDEAKKNQ